MATTQRQKTLLGMAGEFRVYSELLRREKDAFVTFGNAKATDIYVLKNEKYVRVEVKTTRQFRIDGQKKTPSQTKFVTSFFQKYGTKSDSHPDFWVFVLLGNETTPDRFFIIPHDEVGKIQLDVNKGKKPKKGKGCDNIPLKRLEELAEARENNWGEF